MNKKSPSKEIALDEPNNPTHTAHSEMREFITSVLGAIQRLFSGSQRRPPQSKRKADIYHRSGELHTPLSTPRFILSEAHAVVASGNRMREEEADDLLLTPAEREIREQLERRCSAIVFPPNANRETLSAIRAELDQVRIDLSDWQKNHKKDKMVVQLMPVLDAKASKLDILIPHDLSADVP